MAIELTGVVVRNERRLRLVFSNDLASGAFGTPAPAYYVIANQDGRGLSPGVNAALVVPGASANVEIALDTDLVAGALYQITAVGVPALDLSTSTGASAELFQIGVSAKKPNAEPKVTDGDLLLYGRDAIWTGADYLEGADGDLAELGGVTNAEAAVRRRLLGHPLPWAPQYSPRARQYVDVPVVSIGGLRGHLESQALRDDRVKSVTATLTVNTDAPDESTFNVSTVLIGGFAPAPIPVAVSQ